MRSLAEMSWRPAVNHYLNMGCSQLIDVKQHGCYVADNIFIRNLLNEYIDTLIRILFVTSNKWSGLV